MDIAIWDKINVNSKSHFMSFSSSFVYLVTGFIGNPCQDKEHQLPSVKVKCHYQTIYWQEIDWKDIHTHLDKRGGKSKISESITAQNYQTIKISTAI